MLRVFFSLVLLFVLAASPGFGEIFVFDLRGSQEVPPAASAASGGCMGELDVPAAQFSLTCVHNVVGATILHIHRALAGANGPVVFDLGDPASPVQATWTGMTPADIADLLAGNLYLNIHTDGRPAGEIRGQILTRTVDSISFTADGGQLVPPNSSAATASCLADLNDPATALLVQCTHDVPLPEAAHVHEAPAGENGPVVFTFGSAASPLSGNVPMSPLRVAQLAATFLYVDIHSASSSEESPSADIRGQIGDPPNPTVGTIRITKSTFPSGGAGFGFAHDIPGFPGSFLLADGQTQVFADVVPGTYTVTESDPASGGFALEDVVCGDADSSGNPFARTATIRLQAGETVTCTFTNVRASGADRIFVFQLSGDQEAPPVSSPATGGCMGQLDSAAGTLSLTCTHNVADPTVLHVHRARAGENGPVVFDLGDPQSPVHAVWTGMTPGDIADLLAGNLYLNIHTGGRPAGEIRGQLLERTVDSFSFVAESGQSVPPGSLPVNGSCFADLSDDAATLFVRCSHGLTQAESAHLHSAPAGENGPVVFPFDPGVNPFSANVPMSPRLVADFAAGFLYVDIHSGGSEGSSEGDIRGQLIPGALAVTDIPTLSQWGMILLALSILAAGGWFLKRQRGVCS